MLQRVCNLAVQILLKLCVQILKNHEDKLKKTVTEDYFHVPYMPYFKWNVPLPKCFKTAP